MFRYLHKKSLKPVLRSPAIGLKLNLLAKRQNSVTCIMRLLYGVRQLGRRISV